MKFNYFSKNYDWRKDMLTIPNFLSLFRIVLIPIYLFVIIKAENTRDFLTAGLIIGLSGFTDILDGWVARRFQQISEFGKLLDPIADKLTQAALILSLLYYYPELRLLAILFFIKEGFMAISGWVSLQKGIKLDGAKWFGKVSTATFYLVMMIMLFIPTLSEDLRTLLISISFICMLLSLTLYIKEYYYLFQEVS